MLSCATRVCFIPVRDIMGEQGSRMEKYVLLGKGGAAAIGGMLHSVVTSARLQIPSISCATLSLGRTQIWTEPRQWVVDIKREGPTLQQLDPELQHYSSTGFPDYPPHTSPSASLPLKKCQSHFQLRFTARFFNVRRGSWSHWWQTFFGEVGKVYFVHFII